MLRGGTESLSYGSKRRQEPRHIELSHYIRKRSEGFLRGNLGK